MKNVIQMIQKMIKFNLTKTKLKNIKKGRKTYKEYPISLSKINAQINFQKITKNVK